MKKKLFGNNIKPACKYCDFASVCGREDEPCFRVPDLKNEEIFEKLKEGDEYGV